MVAIKVILLVAMLGMASACMNKNKRQMPRGKIDSGTVDIPISLKFQQGPIPSASFSVGVASKMNQHVGNGVYKQHQFNSGFQVAGAAVPVLDSGLNVQGISADIDTHMSHDNQVVYLDRNPMIPSTAPEQQYQRRFPTYDTRPAPTQPEPEVVVETVEVERPVKPQLEVEVNEPAAQEDKKQVGGLKLEYFIAIMCVGFACFLAILVLMVLIVKKKKRVVEQVVVAQPRRKANSVYSYTPEIVTDMKPPKYELEIKKDASTGPEKKY